MSPVRFSRELRSAWDVSVFACRGAKVRCAIGTAAHSREGIAWSGREILRGNEPTVVR